MQYLRPELTLISFESGDILTQSSALPIIPAEAEDLPDSFDGPGKG